MENMCVDTAKRGTKKTFAFKTGDKVRISHLKYTFQRDYQEKWIEEHPNVVFHQVTNLIIVLQTLETQHFQSMSNSGFRSQGQGYNSQTVSNRAKYLNAVATPYTVGSISCFYCNQPHVMTVCEGFLSLSVINRREFCKSQRLCFGCLRHGHSNRDCPKRMQCNT